MRTEKLLSVSIISACLFVSCTTYDSQSEESAVIKFYSHILNVQSRVNGTSWDENDEVGIFMQTEGELVSNKKYLAHADGSLTAAPDHEIFYPLKGTANFMAYYPYDSTLSGTDVALSVADQTNLQAIDFLYSNNARGIAAGSPVDVQFTHQLSKFVVNISTDETITDTKGLTVALEGMNHTATFSLMDGKLTPTDSKKNISMQVNAAGTRAEAIVLPSASIQGMKMHFTLNGITASSPVMAQEGVSIDAGCVYTFKVALTLKQQQQSVVMGKPTITDWIEKVGGDINIEFDENANTEPEVGPEVDPEPEPEYTERIVLYHETCGKATADKTSFNSYNKWTDAHGLTLSEPKDKGVLTVRKTASLDAHIWFPDAKNSALRIAGFDASAYKAVELTYDIAANYMQGTVPDQNVIKVSTDKGELQVPSKLFTATDTYETITLRLPTDFTYIQFDSHAETNKAGFRLDNIKVEGLK